MREAGDINVRSEVSLTSFLEGFRGEYLGRQQPCIGIIDVGHREIWCKGYFKRGGQSLSRHVLRRATPRSFFSHYCFYRDRAGSACVRVSEQQHVKPCVRSRFSPFLPFTRKIVAPSLSSFRRTAVFDSFVSC